MKARQTNVRHLLEYNLHIPQVKVKTSSKLILKIRQKLESFNNKWKI